MTSLERLNSKTGLYTSLVFTDEVNEDAIKTILMAWKNGTKLELAKRGTNFWLTCHNMPTDFDNYIYRSAN